MDLKMSATLTFVEEVVLLSIDPKSGVIHELPILGLDTALIGAALMELSLLDRIDTDPQALHIVNTTPTGHPLLDSILLELAKEREEHSIDYWISSLNNSRLNLEARALDRLVQLGILKREERRILWVFPDRRYPIIDRQKIVEVRTRLRQTIQSDDLPEVRDAVLISLLSACGLFGQVFSPDELERVSPRIEQLAKLDLIGQDLARSIQVIEYVLRMPMV